MFSCTTDMIGGCGNITLSSGGKAMGTDPRLSWLLLPEDNIAILIHCKEQIEGISSLVNLGSERQKCCHDLKLAYHALYADFHWFLICC